ncbi:hypothetical protein HQQ94_10125 [Shewanella sp. VB17]|uniref:hypothetical protein n=1 Tax=Shewanella sp. VB17 TaxID=2739432 RepID=UPI00156412EB|nr:hypothetical protein [Shewanella sp. VB17]NRD73599.1 hypothetical protein [Shewanella sp. VB17]
MNIFFIAAAILGLLTCLGHFTYGSKQYLQPMLASNLTPLVKTVLHCVFHFVSVFLVLSSMVLGACGMDVISNMQGFGLVLFVALNFGVFAIWQLFIAFDSDIKWSLRNVCLWAPFACIAILSLLGIYS